MKPDDHVQTDPTGRRRVWACAELPRPVPGLPQGGKWPRGFREPLAVQASLMGRGRRSRLYWERGGPSPRWLQLFSSFLRWMEHSGRAPLFATCSWLFLCSSPDSFSFKFTPSLAPLGHPARIQNFQRAGLAVYETLGSQSCPLGNPRHTEQSFQQEQGLMLGTQERPRAGHRRGNEQEKPGGREYKEHSGPRDRLGPSSRLVPRALREGKR